MRLSFLRSNSGLWTAAGAIVDMTSKAILLRTPVGKAMNDLDDVQRLDEWPDNPKLEMRLGELWD
jgi:hypothetical protein